MSERPSGRPSKYKEEYCEDIVDYFSNPKRWEVCPMFEDYSVSIGVHRETLLNWCNAHPEFFDAYNKAKAIQCGIMVRNAMAGKYNASFTKFAMANMHGWSEKQQTETVQTLSINIDSQDEEL